MLTEILADKKKRHSSDCLFYNNFWSFGVVLVKQSLVNYFPGWLLLAT